MISMIYFSVVFIVSLLTKDLPRWLTIIMALSSLVSYTIAYIGWECHKDEVKKLKNKVNELDYDLEVLRSKKEKE